MAYDLVAVGGTGQWILLEALLRFERGEEGDVPRRMWIVDPHQPSGGSDVPGVLQRKLRLLNLAADRVRPRWDDKHRATYSAVIETELVPEEHYETLRRTLESLLTSSERKHPTENGFFALPRLAASWVALSGFEPAAPFLQPSYLQDQDEVPLVVAGSVAGGTGAGLIPQILRRIRAGEPGRWRRPILILPVLPWFNPQRSTTQNAAVPWENCRRNASDGIRALARLTREIEDRASRVDINLPPTFCTLAGIELHEAESTAPPDPNDALRSGVAPAFIRGCVDAITLFARERAPEERPAGGSVVFGPVILPVAERFTDVLASYRDVDDFVGTQVGALLNELKTGRMDAVRSRIASYHEAYGRVLGGVILARNLSGFALKDSYGTTAWDLYWRAFDEALQNRATSLLGGKQSAGVTLALDVGRTISALDSQVKNDDDLAALIALADVVADEAGASARKLANLIANRLIVAESLKRKTQEERWSQRVFVAHGAGNIISAVRGDSPAFQSMEARRLADLYESPGYTTFYGASYARLSSSMHKLSDIIRDTSPSELQVQIDQPGPLRDVLTLWRAAIHGLLVYERHALNADDAIVARLEEAEGIRRDWGPDATILRFAGETVGVASVELGFITHTEIIDAAGDRRHPAIGAFERLRALLKEPARDLIILRAFAQRVVEAAAHSREVAWCKLLFAAAPQFDGDPLPYLDSHSLPSTRLTLSCGTADARAFHIPLVASEIVLASLRAINTSSARDLFARDQDRLLFTRAGQQKELARIAIRGEERLVVSIPSPDSVVHAARYSEVNGSAEPFAQMTWR